MKNVGWWGVLIIETCQKGRGNLDLHTTEFNLNGSSFLLLTGPPQSTPSNGKYKFAAVKLVFLIKISSNNLLPKESGQILERQITGNKNENFNEPRQQNPSKI